ncbi:18202_t:CDS:2, partial [Cetraspora pellucida]
VWNFFNKDASVKSHCSEQCKECGAFWACAKPIDLEEHLALNCCNQAASQETIPGIESNKKKCKSAGAGIKQSQFARVAKIAGRLWTKMVGSKAKKGDLEILKAQLCDGIKDKLGSLSSLVVKLFSVHPNAASCEHIWSCCEWILGDQHNKLKTKNLESIVKIDSYLILNAKQELSYYEIKLTEEEIRAVFQNLALFFEDNEEEDFDDLNESENSRLEIPIIKESLQTSLI